MKSLPVLLLLVFVGCASAATEKPTLRVLSHDPLVVQGDRFVPGEQVVLTQMTGTGPRRSSLVAAGGRFRESLDSGKGCSRAYAVRAVGNKGSKAFVVFGEAPICVPPPRD